MMFTEVPCGSGSMQYDFLAADLASVNRTVTPWVIFLGHRPMYSCSSSGCGGPDHSDNFCRGGADVEPLLVNNSVDLVLWGHVHNAVATVRGWSAAPSMRCRLPHTRFLVPPCVSAR